MWMRMYIWLHPLSLSHPHFSLLTHQLFSPSLQDEILFLLSTCLYSILIFLSIPFSFSFLSFSPLSLHLLYPPFLPWVCEKRAKGSVTPFIFIWMRFGWKSLSLHVNCFPNISLSRVWFSPSLTSSLLLSVLFSFVFIVSLPSLALQSAN